jgi:hypothetical protein
LEQGKSFQFLTHPENWTESSADIPTLLQRLQEQEIGDIQDLYSDTGAYYQSLLADRSAKDRAFRERRSARG